MTTDRKSPLAEPVATRLARVGRIMGETGATAEDFREAFRRRPAAESCDCDACKVGAEPAHRDGCECAECWPVVYVTGGLPNA